MNHDELVAAVADALIEADWGTGRMVTGAQRRTYLARAGAVVDVVEGEIEDAYRRGQGS